MAGAFSRAISFSNKYPVVRGMTAYAILWPFSCIIQQTIDKKEFGNYDWTRVARFGLFGSCFVAPTLNFWMRICLKKWPANDILSCIKKGITEQIVYSPFANVSFYGGMSALEGKSRSDCVAEVKAKFWPTYKVGVCFWPIIATINYRYVPAKNRLMFISTCSVIWTCFLAHMNSLRKDQVKSIRLKL